MSPNYYLRWFREPAELLPPDRCLLKRSDSYISHDGPVSGSAHHSYDGDSNKVREDYDTGADGSIESYKRSEYDDSGYMTLYERRFSGDDARYNSRVEYEYDGLGQLLVERRDDRADGVVDIERTLVWENGLLVSATEVHLASETRLYEYYYEGDRLVKATHRPEFSLLTRVLYTYDSEGRLASETAWHSPEDEPVPGKRYEYDEEGRLIREAKFRRNGSLLRERRFVYNEEGLLENASFYVPSSITPKFEDRYRYDVGGKLIEHVFISDGEEHLRRTVRFYYECW
jgi:antitoxin component YwqK of YwqJK toxin-antitoxin module